MMNCQNKCNTERQKYQKIVFLKPRSFLDLALINARSYLSVERLTLERFFPFDRAHESVHSSSHWSPSAMIAGLISLTIDRSSLTISSARLRMLFMRRSHSF